MTTFNYLSNHKWPTRHRPRWQTCYLFALLTLFGINRHCKSSNFAHSHLPTLNDVVHHYYFCQSSGPIYCYCLCFGYFGFRVTTFPLCHQPSYRMATYTVNYYCFAHWFYFWRKGHRKAPGSSYLLQNFNLAIHL